MISIPKKSDRDKCANYRGITLLDVADKLCARILNDRLQAITECLFRQNVCNDNNIIVVKIITDIYTLKIRKNNTNTK